MKQIQNYKYIYTKYQFSKIHEANIDSEDIGWSKNNKRL